MLLASSCPRETRDFLMLPQRMMPGQRQSIFCHSVELESPSDGQGAPLAPDTLYFVSLCYTGLLIRPLLSLSLKEAEAFVP